MLFENVRSTVDELVLKLPAAALLSTKHNQPPQTHHTRSSLASSLTPSYIHTPPPTLSHSCLVAYSPRCLLTIDSPSHQTVSSSSSSSSSERLATRAKEVVAAECAEALHTPSFVFLQSVVSAALHPHVCHRLSPLPDTFVSEQSTASTSDLSLFIRAHSFELSFIVCLLHARLRHPTRHVTDFIYRSIC